MSIIDDETINISLNRKLTFENCEKIKTISETAPDDLAVYIISLLEFQKKDLERVLINGGRIASFWSLGKVDLKDRIEDFIVKNSINDDSTSIWAFLYGVNSSIGELENKTNFNELREKAKSDAKFRVEEDQPTIRAIPRLNFS